MGHTTADYDEAILLAMADAGGGNMYYIEHPDQAASIFNDELQGLLDLGAPADLSEAAASVAAGDFSPADEKYMYQRAYNASTGRRQKHALMRRKPRGKA